MKKALSGPDQHKAFLRKCWLLIIAVMAFSSLSAQDDSARFSRINGYGFFYKRMGIDSVLYLPLYESSHTPYRAGAIKYRKSDSSFYKYTGTQWLKVEEGGAATNGIDTVYTINDTVQVIETADETYFTIINSPYTEVLNDSTIIVGNDTLIIAGASGGGIWGDITGTLSDQTDLDAALDAKLEAVTTDATLTGDGTAGDPLKVDTLLISTRAWRQKGDDSLGAIIATKLTAVNLDTTRNATSATITNDAGDDAVVLLVNVDADKAGLMSPTDKGRLDSLYDGLLNDLIIVDSIGDAGVIMGRASPDSTAIQIRKISAGTNVTVDTAASGELVISATSSGTIDGTGTAGTLAYWTDENTIAAGPLYDALIDQLTIDSIRVGQLRVGTGTPGVTDAYPLDVVHNAAAVSIYSTDATNPRLDFRSTNASLNNTEDTYASLRGALHSTGGALIGYTAGTSGPLVERFRITSAGRVGFGTSSPTHLFHINESDAGTNNTLYHLVLSHQTTSTAAAGFGVGLTTTLENAAGGSMEGGSLSWNWQDATDNDETAQLRFRLALNGTATEVMRLVGDELRIGTSAISTDQGAFTLQNTGGLYQNGTVQLNGIPLGNSNMNILVHHTDSNVYQIPASSFGATTFQWIGTQAVTVNSTTTETTIYGTGEGSTSIDGDALVTAGTQIILKGAGQVDTDGLVSGPLTFGFRVGNFQVNYEIPLITSLTDADYEYEYTLIPIATGTTQDVIYKIKFIIDHAGTTVTKSLNGRQAGALTTTGSLACSVTVDWDADAVNATNKVESNYNIVEVIKK